MIDATAMLLGMNALVPSAADAAEAEGCETFVCCICNDEGECMCTLRVICDAEE